MKKTAQQKAIDNRANQLNPNNPAYYKSRMGNSQKKNSNQNNKNNQKTVVIHHHHNYNAKKPVNGQSRPCHLCGCSGRLHATGKHRFGQAQMRCGSCGGTFFVDC